MPKAKNLEDAREYIPDEQVFCGICGDPLVREGSTVSWLTGYGRIHESCIEEHLS